MKKRILRTLLLGTLVLTLAGCGSKPADVAPATSPSAESPAPNENSNEVVADAPASAEVPAEKAISDTFYKMINDQVYVLSITQDGNYWANYSDEATCSLETDELIRADFETYASENSLAELGINKLEHKPSDDSSSLYRLELKKFDDKMSIFDGNTITSDKAAEYNVNFGKRFVEEGIEIPTYAEISKELGSNGIIRNITGGVDSLYTISIAWYVEDTDEILTVSFKIDDETAVGGKLLNDDGVGFVYK